MQTLKQVLALIVPAPLLGQMFSVYHFALSWLAAIFYGYPSRSLLVIAVTGTKGKTSVTEMLNAILEKSGHRTCLINSIRFKLADASRP
ncbi:MAG: Mur ligase family protein, partial [Patescibacteria group bacterium]